ncbi:ABC transporter ATP-binding protein [Oleidesulfovibrio sp.]|uniref:ABC transporter ATP-binding protein n=1 Tax=Oleidesulfovibrio sp. TaxID=2909707 RepID=UPI003A846825
MLEAINIIKSYDTGGAAAQVLRNVSLTVEEGEFVSVVGRSGSGKTTLLSVLSSLTRADSGIVRFNGNIIDHARERDLNRLRQSEFAIIFQFHHLMPYMTALENVLLPSMHGITPVNGQDRANALAALERVGLAGKEHKLPGALSGGEQQRVAIARALARKASVLFADEPTGSLDAATGDSIINLISDLHKDGLTVVMVTHNPEYAAAASRTVTMHDGQIVS